MDLTPAQKRKITMAKKKQLKELERLQAELAAAELAIAAKKFKPTKKSNAAATILQNAYRGRLAREEKRLFQGYHDYSKKFDIEQKNKATAVIGAALLRKAVQDRKLFNAKKITPQQVEAKKIIVNLFRRKKEQQLIDELRTVKTEKAFDTIGGAISGKIARKRLAKLKNAKTVAKLNATKSIWSKVVRDIKYEGSKAQEERNKKILKTPIIAKAIVGEITNRRKILAQKIIARQLLRRAMASRAEKLKNSGNVEAANKIFNLFRTKKEKELVKNLREEKTKKTAAEKILEFYKYNKYRKQQEQENTASEKIRNNLIAYGARLNYDRILKGETQIGKVAENTKSAKDILLKALLDHKAKKLARYKLEGKKKFQQMKNVEPQSLMVVAPIIKREMPDEQAPVVHPAVKKYSDLVPLNSLATTEELKNNSQVAIIPQQQILGNQLTLKQKLGLEERLISSTNNRTDMPFRNALAKMRTDIAQRLIGSAVKRRLAMGSYIGAREFAGYKARTRTSALSSNKLIKNIFRAYKNRRRMSSALVPSSNVKEDMLKKMAAGKLLGAALLRGNAARTMRNYKIFMLARYGSTVHPNDRPPAPASAPAPAAAFAPSGTNRPPMGAKGSPERAKYMAWLRSKRIGGKRVLKAGTTYKGLSVFGPMNRPKRVPKLRAFGPANRRGRPSKYTPPPVATIIPASAAPSVPRTRTRKLPFFGPANRRGRPSKYTPPPVAAVVPASAAPSVPRTRTRKLPFFGPANRRGRPSKYTPPPVAAVAAVVPKKRGSPKKVTMVSVGTQTMAPKRTRVAKKVSISGLMSVPRAVSTGNGAAARKGRPRKLTTDTARLVKDVVRLQKQGKSTKSITYGILTGSKGKAGKRGRPGIIVSDTARVVRDVIKLRGVRRR